MAGNLQADNSGNILVEFDYNNIIVVDPNRTIDAFGNVAERLVDQENLVMFANLEAEVLPRTKLAVGASPEDRIRNISIAKINFLRPTKANYTSTGYYDELTGLGTNIGQGVNQPQEIPIIPKNGDKPYVKNTVVNDQNVIDNGLLGITSINIKISTSFIPVVTIELEDVQGRALFQLGNNSPYAAFFNLPYPPFYLTLKGYYGQAIKYQLNLEKFTASFNSFSGNYRVTLEMKGYKFNILNEISMGHLLATPHMYSTTYDVKQNPVQGEGSGANGKDNVVNAQNGQNPNSSDNLVTKVVSEKGYQKIVEVYSEYKSKLLIPQDFPELTIVQLMNKLQTFINGITNSFIKVDVEPLTNIRNYKGDLKSYFEQVRGSNFSWFNRNLSPKPIVLKDDRNVYFYKDLPFETKVDADKEVDALISNFNKKLADNPTLGSKGTNPIQNPITKDTIRIVVNPGDIDWVKTTTSQTGILNPTTAQTKSVETKILEIVKINTFETDPNTGLPKNEVRPSFFIFEGDNRFDKIINNMDAEANATLSDVEQRLTIELSNKIEDKTTGIGFKPTVRNITAVVMASAEAFIRLLDDVHTNSWDQKYNPVRKNAILDNPSSAPGTDTSNNLKISQTTLNGDNQYANSQEPVYPWPQFFVESPDDKKGRFQLRYIADPTVVNLTQGYNYVAWPEVEFVEEYMKGITQKLNPPIAQPPSESDQTTVITNINALEFPNSGIAYVNKEQLKFLYEIWERQYLSSFYSGFIRTITDGNILQDLQKLNTDVESANIMASLGTSSPYLSLVLKEYKFTAQNYQDYLSNFSNQGTGKSYQDFIRDFFVTPYIRTITQNSFSILSLNDLGRKPQKLSADYKEKLEKVVAGTSNQPLIVDTIPFTNYSWNLLNLQNSVFSTNELVYNTKKVMKVYSPRNVIANFTDLDNYTTNRPVTNFSYLNVKNPVDVNNPQNSDTLNVFYIGRKPKNFIPTEGFIQQDPPNKQLPTQLTTSILNTPYFINAIQNGVNNWRRKDKYPYVQAAYLFINSLPLATTRERYKTFQAENTSFDFLNNNLDYIASCFKKFGAIHKMPYGWVLKMGSVWHRYKKHKETGIDILDDCWKDFNYKTNYDPIDGLTTTEYNFSVKKGTRIDPVKIILQDEQNDSIKIQTGFFPKVINDFNVFYNGYDLYRTYSNEEIQQSVNNGMIPYSIEGSTIQNGFKQNTKDITVQSFSILLKDNIGDAFTKNDGCAVSPDNNSEYYIVPSLGASFNQTESECFNGNKQSVVDLTDNPSLFNGSVRLLWAAPNYGYFDNSQIKKPNPSSYITKIESLPTTPQSPMFLLSAYTYSNIEEIFSVFDKSTLDQLELEFLNFSKPVTDLEFATRPTSLYTSTVNIEANFRNFQALFKTLMTVPGNVSNSPFQDYYKNTINTQLANFANNIKGFMEYDVLLRVGNPSNFNRRVWESYLNNVVDPIEFEPYVAGSLPSKNGTITLAQSKARYPLEWISLETEVGFSTIQNINYSNNGSYITDFFIDNNIKFTVNNIKLLAPLIKMYATYKSNNPNATSGQFKNSLEDYFSAGATIQNNFLNLLLDDIRVKIKPQQELPERTIQSVIDGQQSKIENYEVFKALNDKWIAGGDYKNKTLFEDMMFLDRASRNIGDTIILDIFDLQEMWNSNSLNQTMSVFTFLSGLLIKNNFTVMPLPAYVNFYNVQDVDGVTIPRTEGTTDFANNMWGTFLNVDYRNSGPKMIAFYVGKPSSYLDLPKGNFRFRDDGFEMRRASENPLLENQQGKQDWAVSNKCVGFNVDIGTRNQNVFYGFSIQQDSGKATSESIQTQLNMVNQANGRQVQTQNNSLYNFYKQRSYQCTIQCLGNALLQPTMYFNLRHVPMFNGPYMVTDVSHVITPGFFESTITGIRQSVYDLPVLDNFLQSINRNLLTKIEALVVTKKEEAASPATSTTDQGKSNETVQSAGSTKATNNSCSAKLNPAYQVFESTGATETVISVEKLRDNLIRLIPGNPILQTIIFCICYVRAYQKDNSKNGSIKGFNHNYATIPLDSEFSQGLSNFLYPKPTYFCLDVKNTKSKNTNILPVGSFESIDKFIGFMSNQLTPRVDQIKQPGYGLVKYYVCNWPVSSVSPSYYDANEKEFADVYKTFEDGLRLAKSIGLSDLSITGEIVGGNQNPSVTPTPTPTLGTLVVSVSPVKVCPPPVIDSFSPSAATKNTILTIRGKYLETTTGVTINNIKVIKGIVKSLDGVRVTVTVPESSSPVQNSSPIIVHTLYGATTSKSNFKYIP